LSTDPVRFAFGVGIGNVSTSSLGPKFTGRYQQVYGPFVVGFTSGTFLFEVGVLGFALILLTHFMIFQDSVYVARQDKGLTGIVAAGWIGTSIVVAIGIFYTSIHIVEAINYCYWFFSGVIATRRVTLLREHSRRVTTIALAMGLRPIEHHT
jgi:hypothetical protein